MKILGRIYIVLAILLGVVAVLQFVRWSSSSGTITPAYSLSFLPATVFFIAHIISRNSKRKIVHVVAIPFCLLALVFWGLVTLGVEMFISTTEVTNVRRYDKILNDYWSFNSELVSHFPRPIPSDANNVRFSFRPKFLQGGAHIQLRYATSPEIIADVYTRFSERKTKSFTGGDTNDHVNMKEGMPTTFFYTSSSGNDEFPDDYEIMIFDKILKKENWNHGQSHGVAISKKKNEVVYWAESW